MFEVRNEAQSATVYLYGTIGEGWTEEESNRARDFAKTLDELSPKPLEIHIDSAGGDVYEGFAIASAIMRYAGPTTAYIDGLAASAASYVALVADEVVMNDFAMLMIHDAWTFTVGNASELMDTAARLDALDGTIAGIIAARTGMDVEDVRAAMDAETWYGAADALDAGMADSIIETGQRIAASIDRTLAERYMHVPECLEIGEADEPEAPAESHPEPNLVETEETEAAGAICLGNHVYKTKGDRHGN